MSFKEQLADFAGELTLAVDAPDNYLFPEFMNYENNKRNLKELWSSIRPQLKRDLDKIPFIDAKLEEMFSAFEAGEKEKGVDAVWAIYNLQVKKLR